MWFSVLISYIYPANYMYVVSKTSHHSDGICGRTDGRAMVQCERCSRGPRKEDPENPRRVGVRFWSGELRPHRRVRRER